MSTLKILGNKKQYEIPSLPHQYLLGLMCCFEEDCPHPVRQSGKEGTPIQWFSGGPKLGHILLPIPDPECTWGNKSCKGFCAGHYLKPDQTVTSDLPSMSQPPSSLLKRFSSVSTWKGTITKYAGEYYQEVYAPNK